MNRTMLSGGLVTWNTFHNILKKGILISLIGILAVVGRLVFLSQYHLHEGREAEKNQQYEIALRAYNRAIRNYFPLNPFVSQAIEGALGVINTYHASGKFTDEKHALKDLRASLHSIRSFYQPYDSRFRDIETEIQNFTQQPKPVSD